MVCIALVALWAPGLAVCRAETHAAVGCRVEPSEPINPRYPGSSGAATLTDGVTGSTNNLKEYLGIEGPDLEVTVRLPLATTVHVLAADFLQNTPPAIFLPVSVDFAVSENGRNFRTVATLRPKAEEKQEGPLVERLQVEGLDLTVAAVRVRAASGGRVPAWHRAPEVDRWLFISEVLVNPGEQPVSATDLLKTYRPGASRWPLTRIEEGLREGTADEHRRQCADLAGLLGAADVTLEAKRFCLQQLALFGTVEHVAAVAAAVGVPELAPAACRALAQLGGTEAEAALVGAAGQGTVELRGAAIAALAAMASPRAVELVGLLAEEPLAAVTAIAIAAAGTPEAAQALAQALEAAQTPERRAPLADALLACAGTLLAKGDPAAALAAGETAEKAAPTALVRLAATAAQVRAGRQERLIEVLEAAGAADARLARSALSRGAGLVERFGPAPLGTRFAALPVPAQVAAVRAVGRRGEPEDVPWLLQQLAAPASEVRAAGASALGAMGGAAAVPGLAALLAAEAAPERAAAAEALARLSGDGVEAAVLAAAAAADDPARRPFCGILEERAAKASLELLRKWAADGDADLRRAAWKALASLAGSDDLARLLPVFGGLSAESATEAEKALLAAARAAMSADTAAEALQAALPGTPSDGHRVVLLGVLGGIGGQVAGRVLADHLRHASADVRGAAARALAGWTDASPAETLLSAAENEKDERLSLLCLRSALTVLAQPGQALPAETASALLGRAAALAKREEERQLLVGAAAAVPGPAALDLVLKARETPTLAAATEGALLKLAPAVWPDAPSAVHSALQQVAAAGTSDESRRLAAEVLVRLPAPDALKRLEAAPWIALFDGTSLAGWRMVGGKPDAWVVRDGLLVAQAGGGGWLASEKEYADYLVEFEFRLPPDGNSGFFLRPPLEGNPAFEGIEVQLLDDAAPQYANLRPDQYCASIYGIAAASPRVSRPAGEWQRLRVLCLGRRVAVWLNGAAVAEADLDAHLDQAARIPGLRRSAGFPGLQNEHGPIEFRALRLKDLAP
jgi:hypothetical protein